MPEELKRQYEELGKILESHIDSASDINNLLNIGISLREKILDISKMQVDKEKDIFEGLRKIGHKEIEEKLKNLSDVTHFEKEQIFKVSSLKHTAMEIALADINKLTQAERETNAHVFKQKMDELGKEQEKLQLFSTIRHDLFKEIKDDADAFKSAGHRFVTAFGDAMETKFPTLAKYKNFLQELREEDPAKGYFATYLIELGVVFLELVRVFKFLDTQNETFRKDFGLFRDDAKRVKDLAFDISKNFAGMGVNIEVTYSSIKTLSLVMGGIHGITSDLVETTSLLSKQLGVSQDSTTGLLKNLSIISKSTLSSQQNMALFAVKLSQAAGVEVDEVMKDVAKLSGAALTMVSRYPLALIKATVEAKKLGTSINDVAKASREILNFTDNVNAEMEASVLLGKSINLQHARELAYRRNIEGSNREILRIAKQIDFENLDTFQMESFARATGRSVDELAKMLQTQRELSKARSSTDPELQKMVNEYDRLRSIGESSLETETERLKVQLRTENNQTRMAAIANKWHELTLKVGEAFLPVIDAILSIVPLAMNIGVLFFGWQGAIWSVTAAFGHAISLIQMLVKGAAPILSIGSKLMAFSSTVAHWAGVFAPYSKFLSAFLGPLGLVISGLHFVTRLFIRWKEYVGKDGLILGGIKAIGMALYDVLIDPFVKFGKWIAHFFEGHSPSRVGWMIFKGIAAIGPMLIKVLLSPFGIIIKAIKYMFGVDLYKSIDQSFERLGDLTDVKMGIKPVPQTPAPTLASPATTGAAVSDAQNQQDIKTTSDTLSAILASINDLNTNLKAGKIGIYIDGQLMSATLARQTQFRGGYATNNIV